MAKRGPKVTVGEQVLIPVRISHKSYLDLKKLCYLRNKKQSVIVREAIEEKINLDRNVLQNADIVLS